MDYKAFAAEENGNKVIRMDKEIWKDIHGYESWYQVSNEPESLRPKGRWTENRRKEFSVAIGGDVCWFTYTCSECGGETMNDYQYCPNCGADMREG